MGSVIGNQTYCDLRHNWLPEMDIKSYNTNLSDLIAAKIRRFVDYFTWIDIVAWAILAMAR